MRGSGGLAFSTGYRSLTAILTSSTSSVRNLSRFRMVYSWSASMMLPWKWIRRSLTLHFYTKQQWNEIARFQAYYSHPVIQFNDQVVGSLIRTKLDVNNPVNAELFNLSQSPCLQMFSALVGKAFILITIKLKQMNYIRVSAVKMALNEDCANYVIESYLIEMFLLSWQSLKASCSWAIQSLLSEYESQIQWGEQLCCQAWDNNVTLNYTHYTHWVKVQRYQVYSFQYCIHIQY